MNNKGQELSLTTIILAALGLIILVVLAAVFTGRIGGFGLGIGQIQEQSQCNERCTAQGFGKGDVKSADIQCDEDQENLGIIVGKDPTQQSRCCCQKSQ